MKSKAPQETEEQRKERERAEKDNVRAIQDNVQQRTSIFRKMSAPTVSLVNGSISRRLSFM